MQAGCFCAINAVVMQQIERLSQRIGQEWRKRVEVFRRGGSTYDTVTAKDLTVEQLVRNRFPDSSLQSIWISFRTTPNGKSYSAVHVPGNGKGGHRSYILLSSPDKDETGLGRVAEILAREANGRQTAGISNRQSDIYAVIELQTKPTQADIGDLVHRYSGYFDEVKIPCAHYKDVPVRDYQNSDLPPEQLSYHNNPTPPR